MITAQLQGSPTRILLVEDNPGDKRLVQEAFREIANLQSEITHCETLYQALADLETHKPDVALVDLGLPDAQGLDAVRRIRAVSPELPIVVLTVLNDESLGMDALKEGAQDYLIKTHIDWRTIWRSLCYAIERQRVQVELFNLSLNDDLTGLYNRRGFLNLAQHQMKVARRAGTSFLVVFMDVDGLKEINDTFGHQEGNHALVESASILRDSFRQSDILARIGGDEFAAVVPDATAADECTISARIKQKLERCNSDPSRRYELSLSLGFAESGRNQLSSIEEVVAQADAAMYKRKSARRQSRSLKSHRATQPR